MHIVKYYMRNGKPVNAMPANSAPFIEAVPVATVMNIMQPFESIIGIVTYVVVPQPIIISA